MEGGLRNYSWVIESDGLVLLTRKHDNIFADEGKEVSGGSGRRKGYWDIRLV